MRPHAIQHLQGWNIQNVERSPHGSPRPHIERGGGGGRLLGDGCWRLLCSAGSARVDSAPSRGRRCHGPRVQRAGGSHYLWRVCASEMGPTCTAWSSHALKRAKAWLWKPRHQNTIQIAMLQLSHSSHLPGASLHATPSSHFRYISSPGKALLLQPVLLRCRGVLSDSEQGCGELEK